MLYLLFDYLIEGTKCSEILKIGYSEKNFSESRESAYNTHNYGYQLIGEVEGTREDERRLHNKYKHLALPGSNEWFKYDREIIEEFWSGRGFEFPTTTLKTLKRKYLSSIIDPDYLLGGTIKSIYGRIHRSTELARQIWEDLINKKYTIEELEDILESRRKSSEYLFKIYEEIREDKDAADSLAQKYLNCESCDDYISVSYEDGEYRVIFDKGRQTIEKLALEAYKNEYIT